MLARLEHALVARWYGRPGLLWMLVPLELVFRAIVALRARVRSRVLPPVPVIIIGNITVGGSGKTPLVIWLANALQARGLRVGVVSRGHGGGGPFPLRVDGRTAVVDCGDEPALVARSTGAAVVVDPDRRRALASLLQLGVDVVLSDDGLQHLALPRTVEIAVVDARRGLGNGHCLPTGPLREPAGRLASVGLVVVNGAGPFRYPGAVPMTLVPTLFRKVDGTAEPLSISAFRDRFGDRVAAVAGIGDPPRFFASLRALGFFVDEYPFPDHHVFAAGDLPAGNGGAGVVVMTAKDAVKCAGLAGVDAWYLEIDAQLPPTFLARLLVMANLEEEGAA